MEALPTSTSTLRLGITGPLQLVLNTDSKVMSNSIINPGTTGNVQNFFSVNMTDGQSLVNDGIDELQGTRGFECYPSPANDVLFIRLLKNEKPLEIKLHDVTESWY
jgi:hypothetical protein